MDLKGMTLHQLRYHIEKAFEHWPKVLGEPADKIPAGIIWVAFEPKATAEEIAYGKTLVPGGTASGGLGGNQSGGRTPEQLDGLIDLIRKN